MCVRYFFHISFYTLIIAFRFLYRSHFVLPIIKSVFITFDQAFYERILALLDRQNCRGFSYWQQLQGRGSVKGEPHYGSHAWPSMCSAIMTVVDDTKVDPLLDALHKMDKETEQLGLRAFVWNIEKTI